MKYCGHLRQSTAITKAIGQLISYEDGKTSLYDALGGNDNFVPTDLKCTLTKGISQSVLTLAKNRADADYVVSGNLTPDATGNYSYAGIFDGVPTYFRADEQYALAIDESEGGCFLITTFTQATWSKTGTEPTGEYTPLSGCTGTATVSAETATNNINLLLGGLTSFELTAANTDTLGDLIISLENANEGSEIVLSEAFHFEVIPAAIYDSLYGSGATALATAASITALATEANATANKNIIVAAIPDISGLATAANVAAVGTKIDDKLVECDSYIDTSNSEQWQLVICAKGDTATEYARKDMADIHGNPVASLSQIPTRLTEPA